MPKSVGRLGGDARGEAACDPASDEARCPSHLGERMGSPLLAAALTRENLQQAWKRVKANKAAVGVDGLAIDLSIFLTRFRLN